MLAIGLDLFSRAILGGLSPNKLRAATGAFILTGKAVAFLGPVNMPAGTGAFVVTGDPMTPAFSMGADLGVFTLTGIAAGLLGANTLGAGTGIFVETGIAATLSLSMPAAQGTFTLTGIAATLTNSGGSDAAETTAFLARADAITSVGATERAAYKALINGLVSDGVFAKLDALYIFATDTQAHALLNLVQTSYNASYVSANGSPIFAADRGFTSNTFASDYIDSNFNPSTQSATSKYQRDSAHYSIWSNTTGSEQVEFAGNDGTSTHIFPNYGGPGSYFRINDAAASGLISSSPDGLGFNLVSRTSSSNRDGYWGTGAPPVTALGNANSATSTAPANANFTFCVVAGQVTSSTKQASMASIGGALNSTDAANFYSRLRTYMTAVGVP